VEKRKQKVFELLSRGTARKASRGNPGRWKNFRAKID